ncbi:hypothetical protein [Shimia aestuarii]|uniref:Sulfotransferase family protein n=1 Tax=Shimia aestuarii TaxID=254406 RepID=A0A1I4TSP5_9RHOB|nr:hypothetical protein [Shimia aestuarii]SFM79605.1 hypothetical protein SAMN04488042_1212 [Shimia aestuarii]
MKLVCHIGTPKTASTFLQNTCAANPKWLKENGILYPDMLTPSPNHITLFYANSGGLHDFAKDYGLKSQEDLAAFRKHLSDRIAKQVRAAPKGVDTMLMSSENLTGNLISPQGVQRLKEFLAPHFDDIRIVMYARRQDDAILSMYGEFMRRGFSDHTFEQFVEKALSPHTQVPYLYYRRILTPWIEAFGRDAITVRKFDRQSLLGGDILTDFFAQVFKTDTAPDLSALVASEDDNVGLSGPVLEFLQLMYPSMSFRKNGQANPLRARLAPYINKLPAEPRPRMPTAQSRKIMQYFRPANTWLKNTFFSDQEGPLFPAQGRPGEKGNIGQITPEEFADFAGRILAAATK